MFNNRKKVRHVTTLNCETKKVEDGGVLLCGHYFPPHCDIFLAIVGIILLIGGLLLTYVTFVMSRSILSSSFALYGWGLVLIGMGCTMLLLSLILIVLKICHSPSQPNSTQVGVTPPPPPPPTPVILLDHLQST